jgi:hypothetical protein
MFTHRINNNNNNIVNNITTEYSTHQPSKIQTLYHQYNCVPATDFEDIYRFNIISITVVNLGKKLTNESYKNRRGRGLHATQNTQHEIKNELRILSQQNKAENL